MHVIFGQELEGCPLPKSNHGLQKIVVGPRGFLDLLEMRPGLPPVVSDELARRVADGGERGGVVKLLPRNLEFEPIEIEGEGTEELQVIAEFLQIPI